MAEPALDLEPELGPEVKVTAKAVPQIGLVAILCVTLGMILAVEAIVRGFFGTVSGAVGWIPYLGNVIEEPIKKIEQKVVSFLAGLEHDIDQSMGHHLHVFAQLMGQAWHTLEVMAANIVLLGALGTAAAVHYIIHPIVRWIHTEIRKVEEEIHRVQRILRENGAHVTRVIVHNIFPRIRGAEVSVQRVIQHEILPLRHLAHEAERLAVKDAKQIRRIERKLGAKGFLALIATAIGTLSLDAIKCSELGNLFKNRGCSLWKWIDDLLGLALAALALGSVCEFLPLIEAAFGAIVGPMVHLLNEVPLGDCEKPPKSFATLNVAAGPLPPPQSLGPFPG